MCGIAGLVGDFGPQLLGAMTDALQHRGPNGSGVLQLEPARGARVGLGHARLSVIDLSSAGSQPMTVKCPCCGVSEDVRPELRTWLTYNGEIYNFAELRAELVGKGHVFHSRTDSEVLLHLYAEEGTAMLRRLNGIYAFALYDGRERGADSGIRQGDLFLARDGVGVKPLYYAQTPDGFLFASEIKSLLRSPSLPRTLSSEALHYHLAYLWAPAPHTMLRAVQKLPPGHALIVRDGRIVREWSHYDLPYGQSPLQGTEEELAERLRELLFAAVDRQMVADVDVGAFLSGGLDSSAVVAMMRKSRPDYRPRCYSIGFGADIDTEGNPLDLPYARRAGAHLDVDLRTIEADAGVIRDLDRMLYHLDEPQADVAPINALLIAEQARRDGIKVLLSGAGGDDIFSGYRRHYALLLERRWGWMPQALRAGIAAPARWLAGGGGHTAAMRAPYLRRASKAFAYADLSPDERMASYFWWSGEGLRRTLYSRSLSDDLDGVDTAAPLLDTLSRLPASVGPLDRMLYLEGKHFLADHNLNYTDKMGMAAGVEVRVPLLDPELIDFATRLPANMKQRGRTGKYLFRRAMEPYLPRDIIYRPKTGFGAPLRRWLARELRDQVEETLSPASLLNRGLFDPTAVGKLIQADRAGHVDGAYTIFAMMCIEKWCRIFVDAPAAGAAGRSELEAVASPRA